MINRFDGHGWGMGLGMGWWWIIGLIILIAIVWVMVKAINQSKSSNNPYGRKSALDILKDRHARGQIDKQEFEERRKDLK